MQRHATPIQTVRGRHSACAGFTYLALLIALGLMTLTSTMTVRLGARFARAAAEEELIGTGMAYRAALLSYARATPVDMQRRPARLEDLLKDPRYPAVRRHLRKLYADPITGEVSWGIVYANDGSGIIGVYSLSDEPVTVKRAVRPGIAGQGQAQSYRDWKFLSTQ
ncbi:type II secretion system protein [Noviherbaspirillum soli]|uniref:type II secretion system protein n=1 Tax=Noviherbaspirillum soli TaxID=1064518 RepID=UPI00188D91AD|nr:type II secretion system protein [Noviherbaspirillum soli]